MTNVNVEMQNQPIIPTHLKVGNKVTYTNEFGVSFSGHTVQGFPVKGDSLDKAYIDSDSYWVPKPYNSLTVEDKPNFLLLEFYELTVTHLVERALAYSKPITQSEFEQFITKERLESARATIAATYAKKEWPNLVEAIKEWEFKNPRIGISDSSLGRNGCLTLLVELGEELLSFDAGTAWNYIVETSKTLN
jgi:hypothetical protein